jgi:RimJ/RimL family protein N-acetyltransferase
MIFNHAGLTLVLRKPELSELGILTDWIDSADYCRMLDGARANAHTSSVDRARAMLQDNADDHSTSKYLLAADRHNGEPIGLARICHLDWKNRHAEYSYIIGNTNYRGTLAAGDMNVTVYHYLFKELALQKVYGYVFEGNAASTRMNLFGGQIDGHLRLHEPTEEGFFDVTLFSITFEEFDKFIRSNAKGVLRKHIAQGLIQCPCFA